MDEPAASGIPAYDPDPDELTAAIESFADPELRRRLNAGTREARERLSWDNTLADLRDLLAG